MGTLKVNGDISAEGTISASSFLGNLHWDYITNKPLYYDAKAITSITRSGTTFTATHMDGTTSTFSQQDNNTYGRTGNTTDKIFLMGATSQSTSNKTTYSNVNCYASGGFLYSNNTKVSIEGHTHNYAGSSSAGGAATSAAKWSSKRTLTLSGDVSGSASFDGSGNIRLVTSVATNKIYNMWAIELYPTSTTAGHGGYIDFHFNNSSSDYTSRIIENASGQISINDCTFRLGGGASFNDMVYFNRSGKGSSIGSQNSEYLHFSTNASLGHWFNKSVYVAGTLYAGSSYNKEVLHMGNLTNYVKDYVVEQGTVNQGSGNTYMSWSYRKWNSGRIDCSGRSAYVTVTCNTAWGNVYETNAAYGRYSFPCTIYDPVCTFGLSTGGGYWIEYIGEINNYSTPQIYLSRPTVASTSGYILCHLTGRWK